ncbi:MAG: RNA ligase RtcB family protein [Candidatus Comchoanobacterales bacterium]
MGNFKHNKGAIVKVIASDKSWIESDAVKQLEHTATFKGMRAAVGLPDLHPGRGNPIGAAFISEKWIYPQLVGNDIGCGMGLWKTNLKTQKLKLDKWVSRLDGLDSSWDGNTKEWLATHHVAPTDFDHSLGTIGGGNHFAELQALESIIDQRACDELGINNKHLYLLVHSGSRGLGDRILRSHLEVHDNKGLDESTLEAEAYIEAHNKAVKWAEANRALIAHRFLSCLRGSGEKLLDVNHNTVLPQDIDGKRYWLHRKGATPATEGMVIIPGSRGDMSYLVQPIGSQETNAYSLAHGAGRKWKRADAKGRLAKYRKDDFLKTQLGSHVICEDKDLIYEEAPQAYKNIDTVVQYLVDEGLIRVVAILRPVITYKTRRQK